MRTQTFPVAAALAVAIGETCDRWQLSIDELASLTDTPTDVLQSAAEGDLPEPAARSLLIALVSNAVDMLMGHTIIWTAPGEPSEN